MSKLDVEVSIQRFEVGEEVEVGTLEHLPHQSNIPLPGRVICVDAINNQELTVLVLVKENSAQNNNESMMQFNDNGLCMGAIWAQDRPNSWKYPESNLYKIR